VTEAFARNPRHDVHERIRAFWDADAETYDHAPGHAVTDPVIAAAWRDTLHRHLPAPPVRVLDVGAGTGALSLMAAELGHRVTALDLSPGMLARLQEKAQARGLEIETVVGPADEPPPGPFDAILERHVAWTLPDAVGAFHAWREALAPGGRLVLYQGLWGGPRRLRRLAAAAVRRLKRVPHDHHAEYDDELRGAMTFGHGVTPDGLAAALARAAWRRYRVERLWDVERAERAAARPVLRHLEYVPRFALLAEA